VLLKETPTQFMLFTNLMRRIGLSFKPIMIENIPIHSMIQEESQSKQECTPEEIPTSNNKLLWTNLCHFGPLSILPQLWLQLWSQPVDITIQLFGMDITLIQDQNKLNDTLILIDDLKYSSRCYFGSKNLKYQKLN
jgi:hypothetical protein